MGSGPNLRGTLGCITEAERKAREFGDTVYGTMATEWNFIGRLGVGLFCRGLVLHAGNDILPFSYTDMVR
jgi:hypothetical protein